MSVLKEGEVEPEEVELPEAAKQRRQGFTLERGLECKSAGEGSWSWTRLCGSTWDHFLPARSSRWGHLLQGFLVQAFAFQKQLEVNLDRHPQINKGEARH